MSPLLLYSTNTLLAFTVNQRYYKDIHYVWCTPYFKLDPTSPVYTVAASSSPSEIYKAFQTAVDTNDHGSPKVKENRIGISNGAAIMKNKGKITVKQYREIISLVNAATVAEFKPLLYVIPYDRVAKLVKPAPLARRANPLSEEFIITRLPGNAFGIMQY